MSSITGLIRNLYRLSGVIYAEVDTNFVSTSDEMSRCLVCGPGGLVASVPVH